MPCPWNVYIRASFQVPTVISNNTGHVDIAGDHAYVLTTQHALRVGGVKQLPGGFAGWGSSDVGEVVDALCTVHDNPEAACAKGVRGIPT